MQIQKLQWDCDAWEDYCRWQRTDKAILKRINQLIREVLRTPFEGIGKPEPLQGNLSGFWSRRINEEHRLVYLIEEDAVIIISCRGHYD